MAIFINQLQNKAVIVRKITCSGILIGCFLVFLSTVYAATPTYSGRPAKGVGNTTIYIKFVTSNVGSSINFYADVGLFWPKR